MSQRSALMAICGCLLASPLWGADGRTQIVRATYRLENAKSNGTGFVVAADSGKPVLVTAAHTFVGMVGEKATIVLRQRDDAGRWFASAAEVPIRKGDQPLWQQHPKQDVAAIWLPSDLPVESVPISVLANEEDWKSRAPEPGDFVRIVGYPMRPSFDQARPRFR